VSSGFVRATADGSDAGTVLGTTVERFCMGSQSQDQKSVGDRLKVGGVPREQKMLKRHLPRVIYHQVC